MRVEYTILCVAGCCTIDRGSRNTAHHYNHCYIAIRRYVPPRFLTHTWESMVQRGPPALTALDGWMARGTGHGQLRHLSTANVVRTSRCRALLHCLPRLVRYLYCTVLYCSNCTCSFWIAVLCVIVFRSRPSGDVQCVNTRCGNGTESWRARSALAEYSNV